MIALYNGYMKRRKPVFIDVVDKIRLSLEKPLQNSMGSGADCPADQTGTVGGGNLSTAIIGDHQVAGTEYQAQDTECPDKMRHAPPIIPFFKYNIPGKNWQNVTGPLCTFRRRHTLSGRIIWINEP